MGDELRKEMDDKFATKKSLADLKSNTDTEFAGVKRRIDALEAEQNRIAEKTAKMNQDLKGEIEKIHDELKKKTRDIKDLFNTQGGGEPRSRTQQSTSLGSNAEDLENLMQLVNDLQHELDSKQDISDAKSMKEDLLDKISKIKPASAGPTVTDADIAKWNNSSAKSAVHDNDIDKLRKELAGINPDQLRQDINNINVLILSLAPR